MVAVRRSLPSARSCIQSSHASIYPFRQIHSRVATEPPSYELSPPPLPPLPPLPCLHACLPLLALVLLLFSYKLLWPLFIWRLWKGVLFHLSFARTQNKWGWFCDETETNSDKRKTKEQNKQYKVLSSFGTFFSLNPTNSHLLRVKFQFEILLDFI